MTQEQIEGNKLIAEFMGFRKGCNYYGSDVQLIIGAPVKCTLPAKAKYHTSWDWQIPAWSKIGKLIKVVAEKGQAEFAIYMGLVQRYENAVFNNEVAEGFQVVTDAITWHKAITTPKPV